MRRAQAEDWIEDLIEFDVGDVQTACVEWRRSQPRRPTPADIRLLAIAEDRRRNPIPEPPYIPPPAPREHSAEEIAEVERKILICRRTVAGAVKHATERLVRWESCPIGSCHRHRDCMYMPCRSTKPKHEDPAELCKAAIELGILQEAE
jgi:hypothetical protein